MFFVRTGKKFLGWASPWIYLMAFALAFFLLTFAWEIRCNAGGDVRILFREAFLVPGDAKNPDEELELYAAAAVLMDGESGRVLYGKNPDQPLANASTTKVMTCILILENCELTDTVSISNYAASMPKVKLNAMSGETYQIQDLLYSLMLESHNDSAVALAEHLGKLEIPELAGKEEKELTGDESRLAVKAFSNLMNQKAREIGCRDTYFLTPNGLDATETILSEDGTSQTKEHHVTARDLAMILAYCIMESPKKNKFLEITGAADHSFESNGRTYFLQNHNSFLNMMEGACSGKTGFTGKAGYCYVGALQRDGRCYVVSLLACGWPGNQSQRSHKWVDAKKLMEYGLENFHQVELSEDGILVSEEQLPDVVVRQGRGDEIGQKKMTRLEIKGREALQGEEPGILVMKDEKIRSSIKIVSELTAPVARGQKVGEISYSIGDETFLTEDVIAMDEVKRIDLGWCLKKTLEQYLSFGGNALLDHEKER